MHAYIHIYILIYIYSFLHCIDYTVGMGMDGELTLFPGAESTCVIVDITRDSSTEEPETFSLNVSIASNVGATNSPAPVTNVTTIIDGGQLCKVHI